MRGFAAGKGLVFLFLLLTGGMFSVSQVGVRQGGEKAAPQEVRGLRQIVSPPRREAAAVDALAEKLRRSRKSGDIENAQRLFSLLFPPERDADPVAAWKAAAERAWTPAEADPGESKATEPGGDIPVMTSAENEKSPSIDRERGKAGLAAVFVASEQWLGGLPHVIRVSRSPDSGATWPAAAVIGGLYPAAGPVIRQVGEGAVGVAFTEFWQNSEHDIHFARLSSDLASFSRTPVACGTAEEDHPSLASDFPAFDSPYTYVAYTEHLGTAYAVRFRVSPDLGATWSAPITIGSFEGPEGLACHTASAFDPATETLYVAYAGWQGASQGIAVSSSRSFGASWSIPVFVTADGAGADLFPRLAATGGTAVLVYEHSVSSADRDIAFAHTIEAGRVWVVGESLTAGPGDERRPDVRAVEGSGPPGFYASYVIDGVRVVARRSSASDPGLWTAERDLKRNSGIIDDDPVALLVAEGPSGAPFPIAAWAEKDPDYDIYIAASALTVTPDNQDVASQAGTTTFTVAKTGSGKVDWVAEVTTGGTWLSIQSGASGTNAGTIIAAFTANSDPASRIGTIRVSDITAVLAPSDVTVTQSGIPQLVLTPATGLTSSGPQGGPFSPVSAAYALQNQGGEARDWTAAGTQAWVTVSPGSGTLAAGATVTVTVSINSAANALAAGTYNDTVTFANASDGSGTTTRPVSLTVNPSAGTMTVNPAGGLVSSGIQGGPFSPAGLAYTLQNTGGTALNWTAGATQAWVTVSPGSGTLAAGATATVTVSVNSAADTFTAGTYGDTVTFTNATNGSGTTTRPVSLTVNPPPGELAVTPGQGLLSSGLQGGPFSPAGLAYTLQNAGGSSLNWTASKTQAWVTLSAVSGTLAAGATATVTVSINTAANALAAGAYSDTVTFTNTSSDSGTTTRPVNLTVNPLPGSLTVTPPDGFVSSGVQGGPFSPAGLAYTLQNAGGAALDWTASAAQAWVTLSATTGTLAPGATATVTVSINTAANTLLPGVYNDTVIFTNTTNGNLTMTRPVSLTVSPPPGALTVTPGGGLVSSGTQGGPFSPATLTYSLQNTGGVAMDWTAAKTQAWVTLSIASGTIAPGATATVRVTINTGANALAAGVYGDTVTFTNTTNGSGTTTRPVSLTVNPPPGALSVSPPGAFVSSGVQGGPFSPASLSYTLRNTGGVTLDWTAAKLQSWLTISASSGSLAPDATAVVTVSINDTANYLFAGTHSDIVTFANTTNGNGTTTRSVSLTVTPPPRLAVSPANKDVAYLAGTASFEVSNAGTGSLTWMAEVIWGEDWVTIDSGSSGTDSGSIVASFTANQGASSRQAYIRVLAPGASGSPKDVTITQGSGVLALVLEGSRLVEKAWIIQREYGSLALTVNNPAGMAVGSFVIHRKAAGQAYEARSEVPGSAVQDGRLVLSDTFLQTGTSYTYKVVALDAQGSIISESNEVTI